MVKPLLVMPCSARKSSAPGLIPARDRYDGSPWRTLRANRAGLELDVLVLSAAHGFIWEALPIADYDRKLDKARAIELARDISAPWAREKAYKAPRIFLMGSALYRGAMVDALWPNLGPWPGIAREVELPQPRATANPVDNRWPFIGEQLADLKAWLASLREDAQQKGSPKC